MESVTALKAYIAELESELALLKSPTPIRKVIVKPDIHLVWSAS